MLKVNSTILELSKYSKTVYLAYIFTDNERTQPRSFLVASTKVGMAVRNFSHPAV